MCWEHKIEVEKNEKGAAVTTTKEVDEKQVENGEEDENDTKLEMPMNM